MYRHGDLLLIPVNNVPEGKGASGMDVVLLEGEVTGHAHRLQCATKPAVTILAPDGGMFLSLVEATPLVHEEHGTIVVPPGQYAVRRQVEYSPEAIRNVAD